MTAEELTRHAEDFLVDNYGLTLDIPIVINNRLRSTLGSFVHSGNEPVCIEIGGQVIKYGADEAILDILRHELIHYALSTLGKPFDDGHPYFEAELRKHSVASTGTNLIGLYYAANCAACGEIVVSKYKSLLDKPDEYSSRCCNAEVLPVGIRIYNGLEARIDDAN